MVATDLREFGDRLENRVFGPEMRGCGGGRRADQAVVIVAGDLAAKQVLARILVPAMAGKALFVARIERRHAARRQQQDMREREALEPLCFGRIGPGEIEHMPDPPHVVIAKEGRQALRGGVTAFVEDVAVDQLGEKVGASLARQHRARCRLEGEIENFGEAVAAGILRGITGIDGLRIDFAEDREVGDAACRRARLHRRDERLPEFGIDVPCGVDAESVNAEAIDPASIDGDESGDDARVLGHHIVEPGEIAIARGFPRKGGVTAIVIIMRVVEPGRDFDGLLCGGDEGRIGISRVGQPREILGRLHGIARKTRIDRRAVHAAAPLIRVVGLAAIGAGFADAFAILDHVRRVIGDDVHIDLDSARVRRSNERGKVGIGAEMRVDCSKVGDPIAVIARTFLPRRTLDRFVLEDRPNPDRGNAKRLDIIEPPRQPLQIAAMIEALGGRIIAGGQPVASQAAGVVGRIGIVEAIGQHEIDDLVFRRTRTHLLDRHRGRTSQREEQRGGDAHAVTGCGAAQWRAMKSAWLGIWATSRALSLAIVSMNSARSLAGIASASG
ncbi:hypothetical protein D9M73_91550 [compost metagenome]